MAISKCFLDVLRSIDYHVGHLSKDLFANQEQIPELLPIFTWFINNITPKSNCVTPKELTMYASLISKHEHFSSLEKVLKAIDKYYDETTKDSIICTSDLEALESKINKSQQELDNLKAHGTLYEQKIRLEDNEISLLKQKEIDVRSSCCVTENNLGLVMKTFTEEVDTLGSNVNKLHDHVVNSMINDNECLTKLASKNLAGLIDSRRLQILNVINLWFPEENISPVPYDTLSRQIHELCLLFQSVTALRMAETNVKCEIAKLNLAVNDVFNIKNYYNEENQNSNEVDIKNYLAKYVKHREVSFDGDQQLTSAEYDDLKSRIADIVVTDAETKVLELETINNRITFIQDSIEHYIMMCDVLWCLMRTGCSMANLKCELVLHSIKILETMHDDIMYTEKLNYSETRTLKPNKLTFTPNELIKFDGYKQYSDICTNSNEIEKLSNMIQQWKSRYHYTRDECNKLTNLQQNLQTCNDTINGLAKKFSKTM